MLKAPPLLLLVLILAIGCGRDPEPVAPDRSSRQDETVPSSRRAEPTKAAEPAEPVKPSAASHDATETLRNYYEAIAAKRYEEAWALRWKGRGDDEASKKAFSDRMKQWADHRANVGQAGPILEAEGFSYVDVPVQIFGRTVEGEAFSTAGTVTLRRKGTGGWKIYTRD